MGDGGEFIDRLLDAHTVQDTATQDFCQAAPCRFPDEKTLCEQFALPKESLSGESTVHPEMWPHSLCLAQGPEQQRAHSCVEREMKSTAKER